MVLLVFESFSLATSLGVGRAGSLRGLLPLGESPIHAVVVVGLVGYGAGGSAVETAVPSTA